MTTGISFENTTVSNQTIWILIDQSMKFIKQKKKYYGNRCNTSWI